MGWGMTRHVAVFVGGRADFGHLQPLIRALIATEGVAVSVLATDALFDARAGGDPQALDGLPVPHIQRIAMPLQRNDAVGIAQSMAAVLSGCAEALQRLQPHILVLLGDRYEALACAQASLLVGCPVAHLHGGETSEGALDEVIRHAITKLSWLHFAAAEPYRRRVVQLGEAPERVFAFGAPGLDRLANLPEGGDGVILAECGLAPERPYILLTLHPETASQDDPAALAHTVLDGLAGFADLQILATSANADAGGQRINAVLTEAARSRPMALVAQLGPTRHLQAMRGCVAVVGNSSSGIVEAPVLAVPTLNIGMRQHGRLRSPSVVDVPVDATAIATAMARLRDPILRAELLKGPAAYGGLGAARRIADTLATITLPPDARKSFHDL
jgi:UDP-hydrolysing UDP-N-acetyl-D-glucosamine 2-epimerase